MTLHVLWIWWNSVFTRILTCFQNTEFFCLEHDFSNILVFKISFLSVKKIVSSQTIFTPLFGFGIVHKCSCSPLQVYFLAELCHQSCFIPRISAVWETRKPRTITYFLISISKKYEYVCINQINMYVSSIFNIVVDEWYKHGRTWCWGQWKRGGRDGGRVCERC